MLLFPTHIIFSLVTGNVKSAGGFHLLFKSSTFIASVEDTPIKLTGSYGTMVGASESVAIVK